MDDKPSSTDNASVVSTRSEVEIKHGSGCSYWLCNPRSPTHRFIALIFMCLLGFGSYFCYDNPGALQDSFKDDMNISDFQYGLLYSLYSWPNVVFAIVGGYLLDRVLGIRLGTILFCFLLLAGQILFSLGGIFDLFWLMLVGRFIFGMGGEAVVVAQQTYAVSWFKGKELNMVFGLQLSIARAGSTVNYNTMGRLYRWMEEFYQGHTCLGIVLAVAAVTCVGSLVCAVVLAVLDRRRERILDKEAVGHQIDKVKILDVLKFPFVFWIMTILCVTYYIAIFPFVSFGKEFFTEKYSMSSDSASTVTSIIFVISAFASPAFGVVVDRTGRNIFWVLLAVAASILAHGILAFTKLNPYVGMVILGLGYSLLASSFWPMISYIVPKHQLGTAFGITFAVQNLGLGIVSIVAGYIVEGSGYLMLQIFFMGCLTVAFLTAIFVWFQDSRSLSILSMAPGRRRSLEEKLASKSLEALQ